MNQNDKLADTVSSSIVQADNLTFRQWLGETNRLQIAAVSLSTAFLYTVYAGLNSVFAHSDLLGSMLTVHLFFLPPLLLVISVLAYKNFAARLMRGLLFSAPVAATAAHTYLVIQMSMPQLYFTEAYLIIFWTFTVSGMTLIPAALSALFSALLSAVFVTVLLPMGLEMISLHLFWIFVSYSFGLLGAFLLERSWHRVFESIQKMETLATTDRLTGLYNRTKLDAVLQEELQRAHRFGHELGIIMMDIDHFKQINDRYGHQMGDVVLKNISKLIREHVRSVDSIYRWGGEEIMILCLEIEKKAVVQKAESLRRLIATHRCTAFGEKITASFGLTMCHKNDTVSGMVQRADRAMYRAKNLGRNRVEML